jgi:hypothetical protein
LWISVKECEIQIDFQQQRSTYNQAIDLMVYLEDYPEQKITTTFNVVLSDCEITCFA